MRLHFLAVAALACLFAACTTGSLDELSKGGPKKTSHTGGRGGSHVDGGPDVVVPAMGGAGGTGASGGSGGMPQPGCQDHMLSPGETDTDCGGVCPPCSVGLMCNVAADCV